MSGCSAGAARCVRDAEVEGSNPFTPTKFFTENVVISAVGGYEPPESGEDSALLIMNFFWHGPSFEGFFVPKVDDGH